MGFTSRDTENDAALENRDAMQLKEGFKKRKRETLRSQQKRERSQSQNSRTDFGGDSGDFDEM